MAATGNDYIAFVSELIYGDMGTAELSVAAPPGGKNHIHWTRDNIPNSGATTVTGNEFLAHHLDYMLDRYEQWHAKYHLPPVRPWDGQSSMEAEQSATIPGGGALPATTEALGTAVRVYYNGTFRVSLTDELEDEVKAAYSYRYWAFFRWVADLRRRVLSQPVFHVHKVFDRSGTVLSEKDFTDIYHQVHHVWHPNGPIGGGWTQPTPFFATSVGQHQGKREISRTQVGAEFFRFHRDHIDVFDRWLAMTGQPPIPSINCCAHDTDPNDPVPPGVDADPSGYPHIEDWSANPPDVIFNDVHTTYWEGDLEELANLGELGQLFATDFNQFPTINVTGVFDEGYHGTGHVLNGDLFPPVDNNFSPRFFAWHGHNDGVWIKREPRFQTFHVLQSDGSEYADPKTLTIVRDALAGTDSPDPAIAIGGIDLTTGEGSIAVELNVRPDPFNRPLELLLTCEVLREGVSPDPMITLSRSLVIIPSGAPGANERLVNTDFTETFVFDGSAATVDGDGHGAFRSDDPVFGPGAVGFKNSRLRIRGYMTCTQLPNGSVPTVAGTISSAGLAVTGVATSFTAELRQGDLIRANGQVRQVALISNATALTLLDPFVPDLPAGTSFERLDGFDHESVAEIDLIQEKDAPHITTYLDRSTYSIEQVAAAGTTMFDNALYVVLQDQSSRPFSITWPADVEPQLHGLLAPPIYAAGLFDDLAHAPLVEFRDELSNDLIPGVVVEATAVQPEDPGLSSSVPQRVTYPCRVTFTDQAAFVGLVNPGDVRDIKVVVTAVDRAGNQIVDDSLRVRLQVNANPFMLDGPTSWLSTDTRVFQIPEGQARFGVPAGWSDPHAFIQQVIANFRTGGGVAGGESFDSLETDQGAAYLEYSTSVGGVNIHNFALAQVRLESQSALIDLRATFRLFRWGTANVEFDDSLAYRTAPSGIGLLGRTSTDELASIPFFSEARVGSGSSMDTQADGTNLLPTFGPTGGAQDTSYFGAYLDINQATPRFPQTYVGDGPFGGGLFSIRDLLEDHHQCMVVELVHAGDPTVVGSTPGTSDNLAQRNLLIVQTANPGSPITRTVQHAFNIDLTRKIRRPWQDPEVIIDEVHLPNHGHTDPDDHHDHGDIAMTASDLAGAQQLPAQGNEPNTPQAKFLLRNVQQPISVRPALPRAPGAVSEHQGLHAELTHLREGWAAQAPKLLAQVEARLRERFNTTERWTIDAERWKPTSGLDELAIFWNNLPRDAVVELYVPAASVEQIFNFRSLRHAPETVRIIDSHTLRLFPTGTTFLPFAGFWGDNVAALLKVQLPAGIKKGQRYHVDVLQLRADEARTLGGFRLSIQVEKAEQLWQADLRRLELFHRRFSIKRRSDRWYPIAARQLEYARARAKGMIEHRNEEHPELDPLEWQDPTETQCGRRVRVVLERIRITDDCEPFFKGRGEFRFQATAWSKDNGQSAMQTTLPPTGVYHLGDKAGCNEVAPEAVLFEGWAESSLALQISGLELDTFDCDDRLTPFKRIFEGDPESWFGRYAPTGGPVDPNDQGGWQVWIRIEPAG